MWAKNSRRQSANAALREWHVFSSVYQDVLKYDKGTENQYWRKKKKGMLRGPKTVCNDLYCKCKSPVQAQDERPVLIIILDVG